MSAQTVGTASYAAPGNYTLSITAANLGINVSGATLGVSVPLDLAYGPSTNPRPPTHRR